MITLYDYQDKGVSDIRDAFTMGAKAPLFVLPTGGGKTVVFCHIAGRTASRGKNVFILVHRIELLRQTSKSLSKSGVEHGLINPKYTPNLDAPVQVASVQTLVKRLHSVNPPDLIIVDEAHHGNAGSWKKIIQAFPNALVLGVTATPVRGDGRGLGIDCGGIFDCLIEGPQIGDLIERGKLVKPIVYAPPVRFDSASIRITMGDYEKKALSKEIDKPTITGDAVKHYMKLCPGTPAVAFCVSVLHAENVAAEFRANGFRAYSVDGTTDDDIRDRILEGLGNGSVDIVTSCDLISEGTDIPAIGCAILLRPTKSTSLFLQQVGRALRTSDGKTSAIILDHVGNIMEHGMPDDERQWSLSGKQKRGKKSANDEISVRIDQCPQCYSVHEPQPICPACGFVKPIKDDIPVQVDGTLEVVTSEQAAQIKRDRSRQVASAQTLDDLKEVGKSLGYKRGWAEHIFKARQKKENEDLI